MCTSPNFAYRQSDGSRPKFSKSLKELWKNKQILPPEAMPIKCQQCMTCRLSRSREWALRCAHEASLYQQNCFLTLTYEDGHLPKDMSLSVREMQLFNKKLRKEFEGFDPVLKNGKETFPIRTYYCGEYGDKYKRPHYHELLFNFDFPDRKLFKIKNGFRYYTSDSLNEIWGKGFAVIGDLTFESAAYVARYVTKKITGKIASEHYQGRLPEFGIPSRNGGIGRGWFDLYHEDVYSYDQAILTRKDGKPHILRPPKYYDKLYKENFPEQFEALSIKRLEFLKNNQSKFDVDRCVAAAYKMKNTLQKLFRTLDMEQ